MQPQYTPESIPTKQCPKCKERKPATTDYFALNGRTKSGFDCHCKACKRAYYFANRKRMLEKANSNYIAKRGQKLNYARKYRAANKTKIAAYKYIYQRANRDALAAKYHAYYLANKDGHRERTRSWRANNRDADRVLTRRRKAAEREAEGDHTAADIGRQYKAQRGKCYYCHIKVGDNYHVDHVVPLSRGGSNGPENLVISCPQCNMQKKNKLPHEWPQGGRLL